MLCVALDRGVNKCFRPAPGAPLQCLVTMYENSNGEINLQNHMCEQVFEKEN